jgi:hypothetical protein
VRAGTLDGKRVLVLWFSQTGQLRAVLEPFVAALQEGGAQVSCEQLEPREQYPFPWPVWSFFDVFPESVLGIPAALEPLQIDTDARFDLVILAYQVWYLAPSPPVRAFLLSPWRNVLRGTPVVSVCACRNMWYSAALELKRLVARAGGREVGRVSVIDDAPAIATFLTTPRWLLSGRRDRLWGLLPEAGISTARIAALRPLAERLAERLAGDPREGELFADLEPYALDARMLTLDLIGARVFKVWARAIRAAGARSPAARALTLAAFIAFLPASILLSLPGLLLAGILRGPRTMVAARYRAELER